MYALYLVVGIIILIMGIITYAVPSAVRFISLSKRPRVTSIITLILGVIMIVVGLVAT
ncbi:MAG: hypothetical protein HXS46_01535 [Theionarchaea archaeon]|nr:hypothetical protein [Theionarchaea archaeon]